MPRILFLTVRMQVGFGVAVVIAEVSRRLQQRGVDVVVACLESQGDFDDLKVCTTKADTETLQLLCEQHKISHVVAHASPFFELLPTLGKVSTWAWEHGDPDPEFFRRSRQERAAQILRKRTAVYPNIDGVIAISEFIRSQIQWPAAHIVRNGWEHVKTGPGTDNAPFPISNNERQLKVGCLMRLGRGEERYKGGALYRQLAGACPELHFSLMGRGNAKDEERYGAAGIQVFRNASDADREAYLQALDIFVSPSLWEGCNLPLLEAQAKGTAALVFDCGAHPEFGGLLFGSVDEMARLLKCWQQRPTLLAGESKRVSKWTRKNFSWDLSCDQFLSTILNH